MPEKKSPEFSKSLLEELEKKYLLVFPDFQFPSNLNDEKKFQALISSEGRKIVFVKKEPDLQYYFEPIEEENEELTDFKRFIGCGP